MPFFVENVTILPGTDSTEKWNPGYVSEQEDEMHTKQWKK
jgi:hypothetical protein